MKNIDQDHSKSNGNMEIRIKKLTDIEIEKAIQLLKELYLELGEEKESVKFLNRSFLKKMIDSGKTEIYLAKTNKTELAGIMTLTESQSIYAGGRYGQLDEMYVRPEFRSMNVGEKLVDKLRVIGREKNWNRIDVTAPTDERWTRTVRFYERSGFVHTGPKMKLNL